jgi:hypothetical protein
MKFTPQSGRYSTRAAPLHKRARDNSGNKEIARSTRRADAMPCRLRDNPDARGTGAVAGLKKEEDARGEKEKGAAAPSIDREARPTHRTDVREAII